MQHQSWQLNSISRIISEFLEISYAYQAIDSGTFISYTATHLDSLFTSSKEKDGKK